MNLRRTVAVLGILVASPLSVFIGQSAPVLAANASPLQLHSVPSGPQASVAVQIKSYESGRQHFLAQVMMAGGAHKDRFQKDVSHILGSHPSDSVRARLLAQSPANSREQRFNEPTNVLTMGQSARQPSNVAAIAGRFARSSTIPAATGWNPSSASRPNLVPDPQVSMSAMNCLESPVKFGVGPVRTFSAATRSSF